RSPPLAAGTRAAGGRKTSACRGCEHGVQVSTRRKFSALRQALHRCSHEVARIMNRIHVSTPRPPAVDSRPHHRYTVDPSLRDSEASRSGSSSDIDDDPTLFHHSDLQYDHYYPAACPGGAEELIVSPVFQRAFRGRPGVGRPFCVCRRRPGSASLSNEEELRWCNSRKARRLTRVAMTLGAREPNSCGLW